MKRREFLLSVPVVGAAIKSEAATAPVWPIGLQLYTVRGEMKRNFGETLARIAAIGYREVEFAGLFGHSAKTVRAALKHNGLVAPSSHVEIPVLGKPWDKTIEDALTIGQSYIITSWIDEKYRTLAGYKAIAALFNRAGERAKHFGIQFGFHNHDFVFKPIDGQMPYDILLNETDPSLVAMQMDVYWIRKGGQDPAAYFRRYPGRFVSLHIKDMDARGGMADVGKGVIPWRDILRMRSLAGVKHIFVEHDEPADPFRSITDSFRYLRALDV
jgi:sugar phosphate isomerase/epimerase